MHLYLPNYERVVAKQQHTDQDLTDSPRGILAMTSNHCDAEVTSMD